VGKNGSGKTTALDSLCFALFNKSYRNINKPQLVNSVNLKDCLVEVEFKIGTIQYLVRRGMQPTIFEIFRDGKLVEQDSKNRDYQKMFEQQILKMNYKTFTQVVILGATSFIPFMELTAAARREVVEDILDIQVFSTMHRLVKDRIASVKNDLTKNDYDVDLTKEKIRLQKEYVSTLTKKRKENLTKNKDKIVTTQTEIKALSSKNDELLQRVRNEEAKITIHDSTHGESKRLENFDRGIRSQMKSVEKEIAFFESNQHCPTCTQEISDSVKKTSIETNTKKIKEYTDALKLLQERIDKNEKNLETVAKIHSDIAVIQTEIQSNLNQIQSLNSYIASIQRDIDDMINSESTGDISKVQAQLDDLNTQLTALSDVTKSLIENRHYLEIAANMLKDSGIKTRIIKQYLPIMNKLINKYLLELDFFVQFELDESFNETIKSRYRDVFSYSSFSEGEKFRIDIALLLTWREIAKRKNSINTNLLLMDEVFDSSLDGDGIEGFLGLLQSIGGNTNVFVISHNSTLLDKFDRVLKFEKTQNFSTLLD